MFYCCELSHKENRWLDKESAKKFSCYTYRAFQEIAKIEFLLSICAIKKIIQQFFHGLVSLTIYVSFSENSRHHTAQQQEQTYDLHDGFTFFCVRFMLILFQQSH